MIGVLELECDLITNSWRRWVGLMKKCPILTERVLGSTNCLTGRSVYAATETWILTPRMSVVAPNPDVGADSISIYLLIRAIGDYSHWDSIWMADRDKTPLVEFIRPAALSVILQYSLVVF